MKQTPCQLSRWLSHKESTCQEMQETKVRSLGQGDSHGGGNGNPLQCSCRYTHSVARDPVS